MDIINNTCVAINRQIHIETKFFTVFCWLRGYFLANGDLMTISANSLEDGSTLISPCQI